MAGFWSRFLPSLGFGGAGFAGSSKAGKKFLFGTPEEQQYISQLSPEQQQLAAQLNQALMAQGAGGAFGSAADYYRDLLSNDSQTAQAMFAPEQRNFRENIIPGLSEQFAGMGSGGLSSSGFRNAAVSAGTDLSERLGAIRAQLRQQGAQGLASLGGMGLAPQGENVIRGGQPGFLEQIAPAVGSAIGSAVGGPIGGSIGQGIGNFGSQALASNRQSSFGKSSPYGRSSMSTGGMGNMTYRG